MRAYFNQDGDYPSLYTKKGNCLRYVEWKWIVLSHDGGCHVLYIPSRQTPHSKHVFIDSFPPFVQVRKKKHLGQ